jgi:hypothetical protein
VGFVVEKMSLGKVFSEHFSFLRQFSFHQLIHIPVIILSPTPCNLDTDSAIKQQMKEIQYRCKHIAPTFSFTIDRFYLTLEAKSIVARQANVGY